MSWIAFENGGSLGKTGSENGTIVRDDEYEEMARITLEEGGYTAPFSITCGVYGWMVHTRFFSSRTEADAEYERMREALAGIAELIPSVDDPALDAKEDRVIAAMQQFATETFP